MTEEANAALEEITRGLDALEEGVRRLRGSKSRSTVLVTASQALVANWLIFRLERFNRNHRGIDVRLDVSDRLLDLTNGEADVGLRCGLGAWKGVTATKLMDEEVIAVASPLITPREGTSVAKWLAEQTRIDDATPHRGADFPTWEDFLSRVGVPSHMAGRRSGSTRRRRSCRLRSPAKALRWCAGRSSPTNSPPTGCANLFPITDGRSVGPITSLRLRRRFGGLKWHHSTNGSSRMWRRWRLRWRRRSAAQPGAVPEPSAKSTGLNIMFSRDTS